MDCHPERIALLYHYGLLSERHAKGEDSCIPAERSGDTRRRQNRHPCSGRRLYSKIRVVISQPNNLYDLRAESSVSKTLVYVFPITSPSRKAISLFLTDIGPFMFVKDINNLQITVSDIATSHKNAVQKQAANRSKPDIES